MAKRSPILGYNHNVRYRGLIFHVQTEDSGVLSPHLFTHLFHEGVIVSTRKLVYDAGSSEEAIKSLMQSQHKAVLKDLKQHTFDDKIDQYLGDTEGLLPREAAAGDRASDPELAPTTSPEVSLPIVASSPEPEHGPCHRASDAAPTAPIQPDLPKARARQREEHGTTCQQGAHEDRGSRQQVVAVSQHAAADLRHYRGPRMRRRCASEAARSLQPSR